MSTYSASVGITGGQLTVTRPHPSVDAVDSIVDGLVFSVRETDSITAISVSIVTTDDTAAADPAGQPAVPDSSGTASDPLAGKTPAKQQS